MFAASMITFDGAPGTGNTAGLVTAWPDTLIATGFAPVFMNAAYPNGSLVIVVNATEAVEVMPTDSATVGPIMRLPIETAI